MRMKRGSVNRFGSVAQLNGVLTKMYNPCSKPRKIIKPIVPTMAKENPIGNPLKARSSKRTMAIIELSMGGIFNSPFP
jgi:hypothetical protein